jgi:carboxypeptidase family protein
MKRLITFAICLMAASIAFAQNTTNSQSAAAKKVSPYKTGLSGFVRTTRNLPIADVQAFLYKQDSSNTIISSGFTDAQGYYETNFTAPGKYNLKLVYPSAKSVTISGVVIAKKGLTNISVHMNEPAADTSLPITDFMPKPVEKKKVKKP